MPLGDLKGKVVRINWEPKIRLEKADLAERMQKDFKGLSLQNKSHCISIAKWIISLVEEELIDYTRRIEEGYAESHAEKPELTPRQLRRSGGATSVQLGSAGLNYREDKHPR